MWSPKENRGMIKMKNSFFLLLCLILFCGCAAPAVSTESAPATKSAASSESVPVVSQPAFPSSYDPAEWPGGVTPVVDSEVVLSNGVKPLMTPEEVQALVGADNLMQEIGSGGDYVCYNYNGIRYTFYLSDTRGDLFSNEPSGKYLLTDIHIEYDENGDPSKEELFRGIKMRMNIKDVLKALPTDDGTYDVSDRMIYYLKNYSDVFAGDNTTPHANMYLVADSFYTMRIVTESYLIDINFSNPGQNVRWIDIFPKGF